MAKDIDPEILEKRRRKREATSEEANPMQGDAPAEKPGRRSFRGATGYEYTPGGPPLTRLSKTDWDAMSQEERDSLGVSTFGDYQKIARNWRAGHMKGGANYEAKGNLADAIRQGGAGSWQDVMRIAQGQGYAMEKDMGQALLKRLKMAFEGTADPS